MEAIQQAGKIFMEQVGNLVVSAELTTKIEKAYFTTSESVDKIPEFEFVRTNVRLYLTEGTQEYKLEMSYYNDDCRIIKQLTDLKRIKELL